MHSKLPKLWSVGRSLAPPPTVLPMLWQADVGQIWRINVSPMSR
jgi:hypothetical protein